MIFKLLIASVLFFEAISAGVIEETERKVSFSIEETWQSYATKDKCTCQSDDEWRQGVQEYYTGVRTASWTFKGPAYNLAENVINGFEKYLTTLIHLASTNSTVLSSGSTDILEGFSKLNKLKKSALVIIDEFNKVFPELVETFKRVVGNLSKYIGDLTCSVNDALDDFSCALVHFQTEFLKTDSLGIRNKVDYRPVIQQGQIVVNTIALIADTLLKPQCETVKLEVYEAVTVLSLILTYTVILVEGINACQQSILYAEKLNVPKKVELCSVSLDYVMMALTDSVSSIVMPLADSLPACLRNIVNLTQFLNAALKELLGVFKGVVLTIGQIERNLTKNVANTVTGITSGLRNLLKGVAPKL